MEGQVAVPAGVQIARCVAGMAEGMRQGTWPLQCQAIFRCLQRLLFCGGAIGKGGKIMSMQTQSQRAREGGLGERKVRKEEEAEKAGVKARISGC